MKPVQVALLVVAGGLAGAVVMQVWQRRPAPLPRPVPVAVKAPAAAPAPAPVAAAEPAPLPPPELVRPVEPPGPAVSRKASAQHISRPQPVRRPERVNVARIEVARIEPLPPVRPPAVVPEPEPSPQQPVMVSPPPARTEPENATPAAPPPPPEPEPNRVTLNAGMLIPVRLVDGLSSERNVPGDTFTATLYRELVVDGFVIAERGARVEGRVVAADRGGKVRGVSSLAVELTRVRTSDGQTVAVHTDSFERRSEPGQMQDAAKIGGGAAVGAVIGANAGGGKGAAVGAGVGGAAGAGDVLLTRGKPATLPSETRLTFRLSAPVIVTEQRQ
jgi:hypothetical protein